MAADGGAGNDPAAGARTVAFSVDADAKIKKMSADDQAKLAQQVLEAVARKAGVPLAQMTAVVAFPGSKRATVTVRFGEGVSAIRIERAAEAFETTGDGGGGGGRLSVAHNGSVADARMSTLQDSSRAVGPTASTSAAAAKSGTSGSSGSSSTTATVVVVVVVVVVALALLGVGAVAHTKVSSK